ncbi:hypothetical protein NKG94_47940 [Micromonospora sp. M12]
MTVSFEEYAALARQLSDQQRAGEQHAAAESARRRDLHAAVDYLHQRLTAQGQRLDQLGRAIGIDQHSAGHVSGRARLPPGPAHRPPAVLTLPPRPEPGTGNPTAEPACRGGRGRGVPQLPAGRRGWRCRRR